MRRPAPKLRRGELSASRQEMIAELAAGRSTGRNSSPLIKPGSEDEIQATFFEWIDTLSTQHPELKACFAIPNAGFASQKQGALRKLTGRRPGVPDVFLPISRIAWDGTEWNSYIGLWIEFKRPGEKPRPEQTVWHERLRALGHFVVVCTTWVDAANIVISYLGLPLEKL